VVARRTKASARQIVGVDVVDPGAGPVRGRRIVVGEHRVRLLERLDRPNLAGGSRQAPEVARSRGHRGIDLGARPDEEILRGRRGIRRIQQEGRARGPGVVAEPKLSRDHAALAFDRLELLEADPMQVLRLEIERRPGPDLRAVELGARRRGPETGLLAAPAQISLLERREEHLIRWVHRLSHSGRDPLASASFCQSGRGDDRRCLCRAREEPLELTDRSLGHDAIGGEATLETLVQQCQIGLHEGRVGRSRRGSARAARACPFAGTERPVEGASAARSAGRPPEADRLAGRPARCRGRRQCAACRASRAPRLRGCLAPPRPPAEGLLEEAASLRATLWTGVLQAVVVALIAVLGGGGGRELEIFSQKRSASSSTAGAADSGRETPAVGAEARRARSESVTAILQAAWGRGQAPRRACPD